MTYRDKKEFSETINISSNIKDNKNTIIGKFDLKDILFILIAGVVGICVLSILLVTLSIRNMFLILIILALFEVPIVTLGFLKLHNIQVLDYIKMKSKSDNKSYRKQILRKKKTKLDKCILTISIDGINNYKGINETVGVNEKLVVANSCGALNRLEQVINDLYSFIPYKNAELKIIFSKIYITIEAIETESILETIYDKLFYYLRVNKDIKYISNEDIKNFETYICSLKFADKKYNKKQNKIVSELKTKLNKLKKIEKTNDRYDYLTNRIIDIKENEFIKVYKFLLYKSPLDLKVFNELSKLCNITSHIFIDTYRITGNERKISLNELNFSDTFIDINSRRRNVETNICNSGDASESVVETKDIVGEKQCKPSYTSSDLEVKIKEILTAYHILYKEINEEKVKTSLLFLVENKY